MEIDPAYEQRYLILYFAIYRQNSSAILTTFYELKDVKCAGQITSNFDIKKLVFLHAFVTIYGYMNKVYQIA